MSLFTRFAWQFAWQWLRQAARVFHRLWLEITGTVFLALALVGTTSAWKEWNAYPQSGSLWKPLSAIGFALTTGGFGLHSFLKARRLR